MDKSTKDYKLRESKRKICAHCKKETQHEDRFDPNVAPLKPGGKKGAWVTICLHCEMVELADDELAKRGREYAEPHE